MEILKFPHPALFRPCVEVTVFDQELKVLLESMWETMVASNGLGLAANQVGLPWRMFVMRGPADEKLFFVNPKISWQSASKANMKEGCLSAPNEFLIRDRSAFIVVDYQDETGAKHRKQLKGLDAVCAQHESEHLDGKSFMEDKSIPKTKRKQLAAKWGFKLK